MKFLVAICTAALLTVASTSAQARTHHHHRHHAAHHRAHHERITRLDFNLTCQPNNEGKYSCLGAIQRPTPIRSPHQEIRTTTPPGEWSERHVAVAGSNELVAEARKYIGTNPTSRGSLWCGAFMDLVLKRTGHKGGGNLASAYAHYGVRISGPQVGAIAVMSRSGGGHVGVVSGIDANGNPIIISGNTRQGKGAHTTLEHAYPRERIYAYVVPG